SGKSARTVISRAIRIGNDVHVNGTVWTGSAPGVEPTFSGRGSCWAVIGGTSDPITLSTTGAMTGSMTLSTTGATTGSTTLSITGITTGSTTVSTTDPTSGSTMLSTTGATTGSTTVP